MKSNKKWMTCAECVLLFQQKKTSFSAKDFVQLAFRHNIPRKYARVGWGESDACCQAYSAANVLSCFHAYKPRHRFTYTTNTPPPADWLPLRDIALYLGANFSRLQKMCSTLTIPARFFKGRRFAPLALFEEHLPWRPASFVRKHRPESWIIKRLAWQKSQKLEPPVTAKLAWGRFIFAPELIHL